ncbi:DUF2630 domain-containing protein [Carbonactinospora thermoautotrophica]|uniref:DUF2630 family protein n=1 Tax=Carbonactinospora thermoautotrophica TaxID=1469144 RepID=A0A132MZU7_9ACTN|nr:DUF2630 family protein [Carbonactinospora thermoautotrophica]KWX02121.1 hypothetical protein LI90_3162 [Carbonactinospora thermoautotrophica]KWX03354.1 hypothetical protein TH66_10345 [Carbonactinospora thermoautotrophica]KWX08845.1 hypothetical protein TR74_13100 [Carbonactinospora thermoautotrophica]MCX9190032.1 DUF2630 domain-containing protein [Carbonactinospora thermoautotrophica]
MKDADIIQQVSQLADEERELRERHVGEGLSPEERERLVFLEEQLDQCWDLLRQRRARAAAGQNPDEAIPRPVAEVESYEQ